MSGLGALAIDDRCRRARFAHYYFMLWDWDGTLERIHHTLYVAAREQAGRAVLFGGWSFGNACHWQPVEST